MVEVYPVHIDRRSLDVIHRRALPLFPALFDKVLQGKGAQCLGDALGEGCPEIPARTGIRAGTGRRVLHTIHQAGIAFEYIHDLLQGDL